MRVKPTAVVVPVLWSYLTSADSVRRDWTVRGTEHSRKWNIHTEFCWGRRAETKKELVTANVRLEGNAEMCRVYLAQNSVQ